MKKMTAENAFAILSKLSDEVIDAQFVESAERYIELNEYLIAINYAKRKLTEEMLQNGTIPPHLTPSPHSNSMIELIAEIKNVDIKEYYVEELGGYSVEGLRLLLN